MKRYQSVEFKKKYSIEILKTFFKEFPEEKRGRKAKAPMYAAKKKKGNSKCAN